MLEQSRYNLQLFPPSAGHLPGLLHLSILFLRELLGAFGSQPQMPPEVYRRGQRRRSERRGRWSGVGNQGMQPPWNVALAERPLPQIQ